MVECLCTARLERDPGLEEDSNAVRLYCALLIRNMVWFLGLNVSGAGAVDSLNMGSRHMHRAILLPWFLLGKEC